MATTRTPTTGPARSADEDPGAGRTGRVVVGVDGSAGARLALAWAMGEAARRRTGVTLVTAVPVDFYWTDAYLLDPLRVEAARAQAGVQMRELVEQLRVDDLVRRVPGAAEVEVEVVVVAGAPAEHLIDTAGPGDLLVVGSRGRGALAGAVLGSVALRCVMHARTGVVVVPPGFRLPAGTSVATVVVGLDGSAASRAALRAAADEALRLGGRVEAVVAVEPPGAYIDLADTGNDSGAGLRRAARAAATSTAHEVLGAEGDRERPPLDVLAVEGPPAAVLTDRAAGADLLVVGSRGRATLPGLVLGSVALRCVVHATCPVLVVHPEASAGAADAADRAAVPVPG